MRHAAPMLTLAMALTIVSSELGQSTPQSGGYRLKVDIDLVLVNVSVRDRFTNRTVAGLSKEDFLVHEDGILQQVEQCLPGEAPLNLLLLLDNSGSTRELLPLIKEAGIDFVRRLRAGDRVGVATFNSLVELVLNFTDDHEAAEREISRITPIGGTAFYDALWTCIDDYMQGTTERSAIVAFTDGVDNQLEGPNSEGSRTPFPVLYRRIQEVDPVIYTIFLDTEPPAPEVREAGRRFPRGIIWDRRETKPAARRPTKREIYETARQHLYLIAEQTGGRMYSPTRAEDLSSVYGQIADDLRAQYLLAYNPSHHSRDGKWHEIRVQVKSRSNVAVRARKGYYARPTQDRPS